MTRRQTGNKPEQPSHPNIVLALLLTCYLMLVLDMNVMSTALPVIQKAMHLGSVGLTWVQNPYMLCFAGFLLISSRAGDLLGHRRILRVGIVLFTMASVVIGLAQSPVELIAARAAQGVGASILAPTVLALISSTFAEGRERATAMGWYSVVAGVGASAGLILGGIFASLLSWRIGFLVNLPIGLIALVAVGRIIPKQGGASGRSLDIPGCILSSAGMITLVYGIVQSADRGWASASSLVTTAAGVTFLAVFFVVEARSRDPIAPLSLFSDPSHNAALVARMMFIGSVIAFFFFTTQLMQDVMGFTPIQAGLGFLPMTIATFVAATAVPRLAVRFGVRAVIVGAHALLGLGLLWLSRADAAGTHAGQLGLPMIIIGLGNGAALGPLTTAAFSGVDKRDQPAMSGIVNAAHQLGSSLGLAILVVLFSAVHIGGLPHAEALSRQVGAANLGGSVMNGIAVLIALALIGRKDRAVSSGHCLTRHRTLDAAP